MINDTELRDGLIHLKILNEEVGILKNDMAWIKKVLFAIAGMIFVGVGKILFFG